MKDLKLKSSLTWTKEMMLACTPIISHNLDLSTRLTVRAAPRPASAPRLAAAPPGSSPAQSPTGNPG